MTIAMAIAATATAIPTMIKTAVLLVEGVGVGGTTPPLKVNTFPPTTVTEVLPGVISKIVVLLFIKSDPRIHELIEALVKNLTAKLYFPVVPALCFKDANGISIPFLSAITTHKELLVCVKLFTVLSQVTVWYEELRVSLALVQLCKAKVLLNQSNDALGATM